MNIVDWFKDWYEQQKEYQKVEEQAVIESAAERREKGKDPRDSGGTAKITPTEWLTGLRANDGDLQKVDDQMTTNTINRDIRDINKNNPTLDLTPGISQTNDESALDFARRKKAAQSKNLEIEILKKKNPEVDFSSFTGADATNYGKLKDYATLQQDIRKAQNDGVDVTGVTDGASLQRAKDKSTLESSNFLTRNSYAETQRKQELAAEIARQEARTKRAELESDRNFNINKITALSNAELGIGKLGVDLATLKANTAQAELDREYLDRRDQRDYEYKIKKDSMDNLDKIFN